MVRKTRFNMPLENSGVKPGSWRGGMPFDLTGKYEEAMQKFKGEKWPYISTDLEEKSTGPQLKYLGRLTSSTTTSTGATERLPKGIRSYLRKVMNTNRERNM